MFKQGIATDTFTKIELGEHQNVILSNDSDTGSIDISEGGQIQDVGVLFKGETMTFLCRTFQDNSIYIRNTVAGVNAPYRIWTW